jgi:hypothetical protein
MGSIMSFEDATGCRVQQRQTGVIIGFDDG